ncbi:MAG: hypothetical protein WD793_02280 [Steroidobacteraceae bacterium]
MPRKRGAMSARRYLRHKRSTIKHALAKEQRKKLAPQRRSIDTLLRRARSPGPLVVTIRASQIATADPR